MHPQATDRLVGMNPQQLLRPPIHDVGGICKPKQPIMRRLSSEYPPARIYAYGTHADAIRMYRHVRLVAVTEAAERMGVAGARLAGAGRATLQDGALDGGQGAWWWLCTDGGDPASTCQQVLAQPQAIAAAA